MLRERRTAARVSVRRASASRLGNKGNAFHRCSGLLERQRQIHLRECCRRPLWQALFQVRGYLPACVPTDQNSAECAVSLLGLRSQTDYLFKISLRRAQISLRQRSLPCAICSIRFLNAAEGS